jgi:hypothetical protein
MRVKMLMPDQIRPGLSRHLTDIDAGAEAVRDRAIGLLVPQELTLKPLYIAFAKLIAQRDHLIVWRFIIYQGGFECHSVLSD